MKFGLFTISTFDLIPMCKRLSNAILEANDQHVVEIHECTLPGNTVYDERVRFYSIGSYKSRDHFNTQSIWFKIIKTVRLAFNLLFFHIKNRKSVTYTIDLLSLNCLLIFKRLFFFNDIIVVYHQFELLEVSDLSKFQKFTLNLFSKLKSGLDLFICPEQNRITYFIEYTGLQQNQAYLLPNTCYPVEIPQDEKSKNVSDKITLIHIGNVGYNHYISEYLDFLEQIADPEKFHFLFVGYMPDDVVNLIRSREIQGLELIGAVPHHELPKYYEKADIGFILYRDLGLNYRYCAPNKLYEYWANGIPVIAPSLPGLTPLFKNEPQGLLIDMDNPDDFFRKATSYIEKLNPHSYAEYLIDYFKKEYDLKIHQEKLLDTIASKQNS
ncbi:MAG: glycosyltransferase [Bacteroidota bacterium]